MEDVIEGQHIDAPKTVIRYLAVGRYNNKGRWYPASNLFGSAVEAIEDANVGQSFTAIKVIRVELPA